MSLLPYVDLRSNIDQTYNQSATGACTAHAVVNALDCMYDNAGQSKRFSRAWIWWWSRVHQGKEGIDTGADFPDLEYALNQKGAVIESQYPWTGSAGTPPPAGIVPDVTGITYRRTKGTIENIKYKLCMGVPVILSMVIHSTMYNLYGAGNWKTHSYDTYSSITPTSHAVCIVGYDDVSGRLLIENSWGPSFGDGGFFGVPYSDFYRISQGCATIDRIYGFHPKKVEGFVSVPYILNANDNGTLWVGARPKLKAMLEAALGTDGIQGVLNVAKEWGITDKHMENMFSWERGTVRVFQEANPGLDWTNFKWAEL